VFVESKNPTVNKDKLKETNLAISSTDNKISNKIESFKTSKMQSAKNKAEEKDGNNDFESKMLKAILEVRY
jgi:hypothetical protein